VDSPRLRFGLCADSSILRIRTPYGVLSDKKKIALAPKQKKKGHDAPVVSLVTLMVATSSHAPTCSHTARLGQALCLVNSCALRLKHV